MIIKCSPIPQKVYNITKRLKTTKEVEEYFPGFLAFIECTEQQLLRHVNNDKRKMYYSLDKKKKRHTLVKNQIMVNNCGYIIISSPIRKDIDMTIY